MTIAAAIAVLVWVLATAPAATQQLPEDPGPERTVAVFELLCLDRMAELEQVTEAAATLGLLALEGDELEAYRPDAPVEDLRAWAFQDTGAYFVLVATRGEPDEQLREAMPAFADAQESSCSLILAEVAEPAELTVALSRRMGRNPDRQVEQQPLKVHAWVAGTSTMMQRVQFLAPLDDETPGALRVSVFRRN